MAYVVTRLCRDCKDLSCLQVCPAACIVEHRPPSGESELPAQVFIDPDDCVDCNACMPECPWEAIFPEEEVPKEFAPDVALNALVRTRRAEFKVPAYVEKSPPTPAQVRENKERWLEADRAKVARSA